MTDIPLLWGVPTGQAAAYLPVGREWDRPGGPGPSGAGGLPSPGCSPGQPDDSFELGGTTYVCRPIGPRFPSEPGRFCLLKPRHEVEWYERFLRDRAPQFIVEVGSYDGASSALFAEIAHPKRLVAIDRRPEPTPAFTDFISRRGFADVVTAHYGVDQSDAPRLLGIVAEAFGDTALDLVVDDASHLVEPTRDVQLLVPAPRRPAAST